VKPDLKIDIHFPGDLKMYDLHKDGGTGDSNVESGNEDSCRRQGE
jgi:hypothetical protein